MHLRWCCFFAAGLLAATFGQAETIVQNFSSEAFAPGTDSTRTFTFDQFDTQGGTRVLTAVTISLTQNSWGGHYACDNDGTESAAIEVQHGTSGRLSATYAIPNPVGNTIYAITTANETLSANDLDATGAYNWDGGPDNFALNGPESSNPLTASSSGSLTSSMEAYIGTGTLSINYISNQASSISTAGAVAYEGVYATAQGFVTVIYTYEIVPEPTSMALLALGCFAVALRRRSRK